MQISYPKLLFSAALALFLVVLGGFAFSHRVIFAQTQNVSAPLRGDFDGDGRIDLRVGDINRDGQVNFLDQTLMRAVNLRLAQYDNPAFPQTQDFSNAGDVNGDGFTNFLDTTLIRAMVLRLILPPPNNLLMYFEALPDGQIRITGVSGSVNQNAVVRIVNTRSNAYQDITASADGRFQATIAAGTGDIVSVNQRKTQNDNLNPLIVRFKVMP